MVTKSLHLIPFPQKMKVSGKGFSWKAGDRLTLAPESGYGDFNALTALAGELAKRGASRPALDRTCPGRAPRRGLRVSYTEKAKHGREGYSLRIHEKGVDLEAGTETGVFYGVQTMRQIARGHGGKWPGLLIEDKPALEWRGLSVSMSQGIMARPGTIAEWVGWLASFKINVLQLYMDGGFEFASHPDIDGDMVRYTAEDMLNLERLCAASHIDFQPSFNSFGHGSHLLAIPKYRKMAETDAGASLCPTDPRTYDFLADIYADYLPLFRSKYFNAGCDEVWDLGVGRSRKTAAKKGVAALFSDHVKKLGELAARHGKRVQIWSDMIRQIPELLGMLPKDAVILNWVYDRTGVAEHPWIFDAVRRFREEGFDVWGAPGVHNWGSLMSRHHTAARNIRDHAAALLRHGGTGMLNTDWNESGVPRLPGTGFHGYALGAAESWSPGALSEKEFDDAFSLLGLDDSSGRAMAAIKTIGKYLDNDAPAETTMTYGYLRQPFPSRPRNMRINPSPDYFDRMTADIGAVRGELARVGPPCFRKAYTLAGQMSWLGARLARLNAGWHGVGTRVSLPEIKNEAKRLAGDMRTGISLLEKEWPGLATPDGLSQTVGSLGKIIESLESANFNPYEKSDVSDSRLPVANIPNVGGEGRGMAALSGFQHLKRFPEPPPYHHEMGVEIGCDEKALHVKFTGNEPDMRKYKSDGCMMELLGFGSYFEIFLAPDEARPFCYCHLTVSVTGRMLGLVGAPFTGVSAESVIKGGDFIVDVRLPWKGIGGRPRRGQKWRGNFTYSVFKDMEFMTWAPLKGGFLDSDNFGILAFS